MATQEDTIKSKRVATVYDAVAGRVSARGFIHDTPFISSTRDTATSSTAAVGPESVLFRRKNAPVRYEEHDYYFANENLPERALPDSDLLKSLHCYTSDYYSYISPERESADWQSMDETALLAMGILMEEMCRDALGETGDLVFTEGEIVSEGELGSKAVPERSGEILGSVVKRPEAARRSGKTRRRKRQRLDIDKPTQIND